MSDKIYLSIHKAFIREVTYTDDKTGQHKTFNSVSLPGGTRIAGKDVGGYQFSPLFVNASKYKGENYRDIPLLIEKEVWLSRVQLDDDGQPVLDADGKALKDIIKAMPAEIKEALAQERKEFLAEKKAGRPRLGSMIANAQAARKAASEPVRAGKTKEQSLE